MHIHPYIHYREPHTHIKWRERGWCLIIFTDFFIFFYRSLPPPPLPALSRYHRSRTCGSVFWVGVRSEPAQQRRGIESDVTSHYGSQTCQLHPIKIQRNFFSGPIQKIGRSKPNITIWYKYCNYQR